MIDKRLKELRKELRLTQQEFADKLGIKRNTIATYEAGKSKPSDSAIVLICNTFNVSIEWLRNGTGEMFLPDTGDEIEALVKKYNCSPKVSAFIKKLVTLPPDQQATVMDFFIGFTADVKSAENMEEDKRDLSIDEKVEAYRRALEEEKEAAEKSEVS